jgi:hypothetical protein
MKTGLMSSAWTPRPHKSSLQTLVFRSIFAVWEKCIEVIFFKIFSAILMSQKKHTQL